jgi:hypothetical protein
MVDDDLEITGYVTTVVLTRRDVEKNTKEIMKINIRRGNMTRDFPNSKQVH